jgi:hypothetical protein
MRYCISGVLMFVLIGCDSPLSSASDPEIAGRYQLERVGSASLPAPLWIPQSGAHTALHGSIVLSADGQFTDTLAIHVFKRDALNHSYIQSRSGTWKPISSGLNPRLALQTAAGVDTAQVWGGVLVYNHLGDARNALWFSSSADSLASLGPSVSALACIVCRH